MSMTDPIADFLSHVRNAITARKRSVTIPASNLKAKLAQILVDEGYVAGVRRTEDSWQGVLELELKYDKDQKSAIEGMKRMSRPGQRLYAKAADVPKVRNGLGIAVVTTSKGLMTDREARRRSLGGEVICAVW
ncbi:30S ribosomal protein S8 [Myxococcota bacterium]